MCHDTEACRMKEENYCPANAAKSQLEAFFAAAPNLSL
jgi:hypothetical protein